MDTVVTSFFSRETFAANCYALKDGDDIAIIDPGFESPELTDYIKANSKSIKYILLTHCHFDHIMGVNEVIKNSGIAAKVVISNIDFNGLNNPEVNLCSMFGEETDNINADITVADGDTLPFSDSTINVIATPGHTAGSVIYTYGDCMFSGDTLFCGSIGRTDFISGSVTEMQNSLKKIKKISADYKIYPGHNAVTSLNIEKEQNIYLK